MAGPAFRAAAVRVRVPATSANLGPGFDAFGLALGLYDDVVVRVADSGLHVDIAGEGADSLSRDENHLVVRSLRTAFDLLGGQPRGLEVVCANRIPHGRGLGSSSAAICAGIMAARAVTIGGQEKLDDAALLELANEIEGHPDNVAACLLGGFTLAWTEGGAAHAVRMDPSASVVPVVFVPGRPVLTETARGCCRAPSRMWTPRSTRDAPHSWSRPSPGAPTCCSPPPRTGCTRSTGRPRCRRARHW